MIGAGWLGDVHARAWARLRHHYPDLNLQPRLEAVADSVPAALTRAVSRHGYLRSYDDWRDLVDDPAVQAISVTTPNALHREIGAAVAAAGKHLWIEKPVGLSVEDARIVRDAVRRAGVAATVGFNYRSVPAYARLCQLVAEGAIGTPTHASVSLRSDYAAHPLGALSWRFQAATGGHGILGDLGSHAVDLTRAVLGDLEALVAQTATFIRERPLPDEGEAAYGHGLGRSDAPSGLVENEDYLVALARTRRGALVTLECSRVATGEQNSYRVEVHATQGFVAWDYRTTGELWVSSGIEYVDQPVRRVLVGAEAGDYARFQPGSANAMSYGLSRANRDSRNLQRALKSRVTGIASEKLRIDQSRGVQPGEP